MRPVSRRRARQARTRAEVVRIVRERDRTCRARWIVPEVACRGEGDVHELVQRSLWPAGYLEPANCILLCRAHHDWIDDHIDEAHDLDLLRRSTHGVNGPDRP